MHRYAAYAARLTALLLLSALLLLAGCGSAGPAVPEDTPDAPDTAAPDTAAAAEDDASYAPIDLPADLKFSGEEVRFLSRGQIRDEEDGKTSQSIFTSELLVEDLNNNVINDAIYNRQIWAEDLLGIRIVEVAPSGGLSVPQYLERMMSAGDQDCEVMAYDPMGCVSSALKGYCMNIREMPYIDLQAPWWYPSFSDRASVGDGLFCINGDLSLTTLREAYVIAYNRSFAEDRGIDDIYDLVFAGKWTLDALSDTINGLYMDLNGNSEVDPEDRFGLVGNYCFADSFWVSFGLPVFTKDADGHLAFTLDQEKYAAAYEKTLRLRKSRDTDLIAEEPRKTFTAGGALFYGMELCKTETPEMRNMQDVYGIVPVPKYDEDQAGYYTMPHDTHTVFCVPANVRDPALVGAALDALDWYSYRYVTPAYLDVALKGQYANDPETRRILDLVTDGLSFESAWIFSFQLTEIAQMWRSNLHHAEENYTSVLASKERKIRILLKDLNEQFDRLAE